MANMCRSRTGDWSVVIGPGLALALDLLYIFVYIFSFSSLVRVVANLRRCLHYHINYDLLYAYIIIILNFLILECILVYTSS